MFLLGDAFLPPQILAGALLCTLALIQSRYVNFVKIMPQPLNGWGHDSPMNYKNALPIYEQQPLLLISPISFQKIPVIHMRLK